MADAFPDQSCIPLALCNVYHSSCLEGISADEWIGPQNTPLRLRFIKNEAVPLLTHLPSQSWKDILKYIFNYYRNICKCAVGLPLKLGNVEYQLLIYF